MCANAGSALTLINGPSARLESKSSKASWSKLGPDLAAALLSSLSLDALNEAFSLRIRFVWSRASDGFIASGRNNTQQ